MKRTIAAISSVLVAALTATSGCEVAPHAKPVSSVIPIAPDKLTLRPGDKLELKFYYAPELNESQQIRPDGQITLQLVGDLQAAGKTPAELTDDLKAAYASQLKEPQVTVIVREMQEQKVYVTGEVERPGPIELPGNMSVLDAVMASGGFNMTTAETRSVIVMRYEGGKRVGYKVDLHDAMLGGESNAFALAPQDIVFVPRTAIVNVDNFVSQYMSETIPKSGFVYTHPSSGGTIGLDTSSR